MLLTQTPRDRIHRGRVWHHIRLRCGPRALARAVILGELLRDVALGLLDGLLQLSPQIVPERVHARQLAILLVLHQLLLLRKDRVQRTLCEALTFVAGLLESLVQVHAVDQRLFGPQPVHALPDASHDSLDVLLLRPQGGRLSCASWNLSEPLFDGRAPYLRWPRLRVVGRVASERCGCGGVVGRSGRCPDHLSGGGAQC
mmetsp:Transcript_39439/g.85819  ORF Transcript_39439/g.85819 Transcript_39439/m.85819 type:complete len:200 (+) Transcript_39439:3446-4045(+)